MNVKLKGIHFKAFPLIFAMVFVSLQNARADAYGWGNLGSGINGTVYAVTYLSGGNGGVIAAGGFTQAGGVSALNIARFNGSAWLPMGSGLNDTVFALIVFNGNLYAAGKFVQSGANRIAIWNGTSNTWEPWGLGFNGDVRALAIYNSRLYAAGLFTSSGLNTVNRISFWNPSVNRWDSLGPGVNNAVYALTVYNPGTTDHLFVGGDFTQAGGQPANRIASWNVVQWWTVGSGMNGSVLAMTVHQDQLIAGGSFTNAGGNAANRIAAWNGQTWSPLGTGMESAVLSLSSYNDSALFAGGAFRYANGHYVDRIAKWNGSDWSRMITGTNNKVNTLFVRDTMLFVGGNFTTAGGKFISRIATWSNQETVTISGNVRYRDNNQPVTQGRVRAVRIDVNTREIIIIDSTNTDANGNYVLSRVLKDTNTYILIVPNDEFLRMQQPNYVPTYYPSSVDWETAVRLNPQGNLSNINIRVFRITPTPENPMAADVSGHVYLNFTPALNPLLDIGLPYKSGAIVYVRQDTLYRMFDITNTLEEYLLPQLASGTYQFYVNRMGYESESRYVTVGNVNLDTIDFYLDTVSIIGIQTISTEVPSSFRLHQNYPNPFNPTTVIRYQIAVNSFVTLKVYDLLGKEVITLVSQEFQPGTYQVTWNALNLSSGVYVYSLEARSVGSSRSQFLESKRMVLIK